MTSELLHLVFHVAWVLLGFMAGRWYQRGVTRRGYRTPIDADDSISLEDLCDDD